MASDKRSRNEILKEQSRFLRGTIAEGLANVATGAIVEDDTQLLKFHGSYMQDDRDVRGERAKKKLEKAYSFMVRLRIPGGRVTAKAVSPAKALSTAAHAAPEASAAPSKDPGPIAVSGSR